MHSTEAAITSLEGKINVEKLPELAIPSQKAIVLNSIGVPPATLTNSANFRKGICSELISFYELTIAILGFFRSSGE